MKRFAAEAVLGHGKEGDGAAFYIQIPDRKPLLVATFWQGDRERDEIADVIRGVGVCELNRQKTECKPLP